MSATKFPTRLVIASRESRLAMWQAEHVKARLSVLYPDCEVVIDAMTTRGDQILDRSLAKVGGKGLFIKELELALASGRCDLAVHSLKDVPMVLEEQFMLAAILEREDPRDAWVSTRFPDFEDLPATACVGTSSLRREAQLKERRPGLRVAPLRGNLDTRLAKLDRGEFDGIVLAAAGLTRLGLAARIARVLAVEVSLPAPGQGALAIEICRDREELKNWLAPLQHQESAASARCERAVSRELGGSCEIPLAAFAEVAGDRIHARALVASQDGTRVLRAALDGSLDAPEELGTRLAGVLIDKGASELLRL
jgi:hydroxymethylbilane synthase